MSSNNVSKRKILFLILEAFIDDKVINAFFNYFNGMYK